MQGTRSTLPDFLSGPPRKGDPFRLLVVLAAPMKRTKIAHEGFRVVAELVCVSVWKGLPFFLLAKNFVDPADKIDPVNIKEEENMKLIIIDTKFTISKKFHQKKLALASFRFETPPSLVSLFGFVN